MSIKDLCTCHEYTPADDDCPAHSQPIAFVDELASMFGVTVERCPDGYVRENEDRGRRFFVELLSCIRPTTAKTYGDCDGHCGRKLGAACCTDDEGQGSYCSIECSRRTLALTAEGHAAKASGLMRRAEHVHHKHAFGLAQRALTHALIGNTLAITETPCKTPTQSPKKTSPKPIV